MKEAVIYSYDIGLLNYNYITNITKANSKALNDKISEKEKWSMPIHKKAKNYYDELKNSKNETLLNILKGLSIEKISKNETKNRYKKYIKSELNFKKKRI